MSLYVTQSTRAGRRWGLPAPDGLTVAGGRPARHAAEDGQWQRSDAWVLAAIRVCGSVQAPGTLFDLIAASDAVNGLIVSRAELEHAMSLLIGAGLVIADGRGIAVTASGRAAVAEAGLAALGRRGAGHGDAQEAARARIEGLLAVLRRLDATPVRWSLDPRAYQAACLEYQHTRRAEYREPGRRR